VGEKKHSGYKKILA